MNIIFEKVRWKNLLSTGNNFTELNLNDKPTTLIIGTNGSGKSTVLDALSLGLYGKPFRKITKPQLINSINKKNLVVEVEFKISKNKYIIKRGMSPTYFEIWINGKLKDQDASVSDYQDFLEKNILKLNHKSFTQVIVLGASTFVPFMQLNTGERRKVIEDLLDIQIFSIMNSLLKEKVQQAKIDRKEIKFQLENAASMVAVHTRYLNEIKQDKKKQLEDNKQKIETAKTIINQYHSELDLLLPEIEKNNSRIQNQTAIKESHQKYIMLKNEMLDKLKRITNGQSFFENNDNCPTCKQIIDSNFKKNEIDKRDEQQRNAKQAIELIDQKLDLIKQKIDFIEECKSVISEKTVKRNEILMSISVQESVINSLTSDISEISDSKSSIAEKENEIKSLQNEIKKLKKREESLIEDVEVLAAASFLLKDGGIKTKIVKQYIPIMNKLINKYLAAMDFYTKFELDENFKETIRSRHRDDFSYHSFSEGEKMMINLGLLFTWRAISKIRNSASTNLLIMDEIFDSSLDTERLDLFMKILSDLTADTNVFIISHKTDTILDKFSNVIKFEKVKNFSQIVEE